MPVMKRILIGTSVTLFPIFYAVFVFVVSEKFDKRAELAFLGAWGVAAFVLGAGLARQSENRAMAVLGVVLALAGLGWSGLCVAAVVAG